jgi:hypothetical protein
LEKPQCVGNGATSPIILWGMDRMFLLVIFGAVAVLVMALLLALGTV